jgi:hypothetical protein
MRCANSGGAVPCCGIEVKNFAVGDSRGQAGS